MRQVPPEPATREDVAVGPGTNPALQYLAFVCNLDDGLRSSRPPGAFSLISRDDVYRGDTRLLRERMVVLSKTRELGVVGNLLERNVFAYSQSPGHTSAACTDQASRAALAIGALLTTYSVPSTWHDLELARKSDAELRPNSTKALAVARLLANEARMAGLQAFWAISPSCFVVSDGKRHFIIDLSDPDQFASHVRKALGSDYGSPRCTWVSFRPLDDTAEPPGAPYVPLPIITPQLRPHLQQLAQDIGATPAYAAGQFCGVCLASKKMCGPKTMLRLESARGSYIVCSPVCYHRLRPRQQSTDGGDPERIKFDVQLPEDARAARSFAYAILCDGTYSWADMASPYSGRLRAPDTMDAHMGLFVETRRLYDTHRVVFEASCEKCGAVRRTVDGFVCASCR